MPAWHGVIQLVRSIERALMRGIAIAGIGEDIVERSVRELLHKLYALEPDSSRTRAASAFPGSKLPPSQWGRERCRDQNVDDVRCPDCDAEAQDGDERGCDQGRGGECQTHEERCDLRSGRASPLGSRKRECAVHRIYSRNKTEPIAVAPSASRSPAIERSPCDHPLCLIARRVMLRQIRYSNRAIRGCLSCAVSASTSCEHSWR
jgi:hypothetical protein